MSFKSIPINRLRVRHIMREDVPTGAHNAAHSHDFDIASCIRRQLHLLFMLGLEMDWQSKDDRIRPEVRKKVANYKTKHIDWVTRDIYSDQNSEAAAELRAELNSDRARDLQQLIDTVIQYGNIGEIHERVKEMIAEAEANGTVTHVELDVMNR